MIFSKKWFLNWWCDNPADERNKRIQSACEYYIKKNDLVPVFCYVYKDDFKENEDVEFSFGIVKVRYDKQIIKNCFLIGQEEKFIEK